MWLVQKAKIQKEETFKYKRSVKGKDQDRFTQDLCRLIGNTGEDFNPPSWSSNWKEVMWGVMERKIPLSFSWMRPTDDGERREGYQSDSRNLMKDVVAKVWNGKWYNCLRVDAKRQRLKEAKLEGNVSWMRVSYPGYEEAMKATGPGMTKMRSGSSTMCGVTHWRLRKRYHRHSESRNWWGVLSVWAKTKSGPHKMCPITSIFLIVSWRVL